MVTLVERQLVWDSTQQSTIQMLLHILAEAVVVGVVFSRYLNQLVVREAEVAVLVAVMEVLPKQEQVEQVVA
jgi:hypothetical protein